MPDMERVTVTLPHDLVRDIDRQEKNRSKFVVEAVRRELEHRRRQELRRSLENPHAETIDMADLGLAEWALGLPAEDTEALLDASIGIAVEWKPGTGWVEPRGRARK